MTCGPPAESTFHAVLGSGYTLSVSDRLLLRKKPGLNDVVSCMTTSYLPLVEMLLTFCGIRPGENWPQLAGLSLIAACRRSNQKTTSIASIGAPLDHLSPGLIGIVTVLSPLLKIGALAALRA